MLSASDPMQARAPRHDRFGQQSRRSATKAARSLWQGASRINGRHSLHRPGEQHCWRRTGKVVTKFPDSAQPAAPRNRTSSPSFGRVAPGLFRQGQSRPLHRRGHDGAAQFEVTCARDAGLLSRKRSRRPARSRNSTGCWPKATVDVIATLAGPHPRRPGANRATTIWTTKRWCSPAAIPLWWTLASGAARAGRDSDLVCAAGPADRG